MYLLLFFIDKYKFEKQKIKKNLIIKVMINFFVKKKKLNYAGKYRIYIYIFFNSKVFNLTKTFNSNEIELYVYIKREREITSYIFFKFLFNNFNLLYKYSKM